MGSLIFSLIGSALWFCGWHMPHLGMVAVIMGYAGYGCGVVSFILFIVALVMLCQGKGAATTIVTDNRIGGGVSYEVGGAPIEDTVEVEISAPVGLEVELEA